MVMVVSTSSLLTTSKLPPPITQYSSRSSVTTMMSTTTEGDHKSTANSINYGSRSRRELLLTASSFMTLTAGATALAADGEEVDEYAKDTNEVIDKVRTTIGMEKTDPNVASAVAELREASNSWVAKYRKEKALLGRASFRDVYSALNAVSGHYVSFGPTAPIPAKRKARILEEVETAQKALIRGR